MRSSKESFPRPARALLQTTYVALPILLGFYVWTGWDAARLHSWEYVNPVTWGAGPFLTGCSWLLHGSIGRVWQALLAFYRDEPWVKWVLIDHLGLKILLSFLVSWDAWKNGRRAWPYIMAMYVIGAIAPLLYFLPALRAAQLAESTPAQPRPTTSQAALWSFR